MPVRSVLLVFLLVSGASCGTPGASVPRPSQFQIRLWSAPAPVGDGTSEPCATELQVSLPSPERNTRAAIVICPGG